MALPATRPPDLQRYDIIGFQAGMVDFNLPTQQPHATFLYNLRVCREGLELAPGWVETLSSTAINPQTDQIFCVQDVISPGGYVDVFIFLNRTSGQQTVPKVYMWNSARTNFVDVTPPGMVTPFYYSPQVVLFKDKYYTATPDGVFRLSYTGSQKIANAPGAFSIGVLGYRLVLGGIVGGNPWTIRWSGLDNPENWDAMHTLDLPNYDDIIALHPFSDRLLVVTPSRLYILSYTGNPVTPFAVALASQIPTTIDLPGQITAINTHDLNLAVYAIEDGVFVFTGRESQLISQNIHNYYRKIVMGSTLYVTYDPYSTEIWVYAPSHSTIMCYQVLFKSWYLRDKPANSYVIRTNRMYQARSTIVPAFLALETDRTKIYTLRYPIELDQRRGNNSATFELVTPPIEVGAVGAVKTFTSAILWWSIFSEPGSVSGLVNVYYKTSHTFGGISYAPLGSWNEYSQVNLNATDIEEVHIHRTGRYARLRLSGLGINNMFVLHGIMLFWH